MMMMSVMMSSVINMAIVTDNELVHTYIYQHIEAYILITHTSSSLSFLFYDIVTHHNNHNHHNNHIIIIRIIIIYQNHLKSSFIIIVIYHHHLSAL